MIINTAGEYTLQYTATDACGNTTTVERELVVEAPPRTVLYTDGTLIINELSRDIDANIQAHGQPTNVYAPFDPNGANDVDKYIFSSGSQRPWDSQRTSILSVEIGSNIAPYSFAYWFSGLELCTSIILSNVDASAVTDMSNMFYDCQALTTLDLSNFNVSKVTNMNSMFHSCYALATLNLSSFGTSEVTNMKNMFGNCKALTTLDLSSFDTSKVTNMNSMFNYCQALTTLNLSGFNTGEVTDMSYMFCDCQALASLDLNGFNTSKVNNMQNMFYDCYALTNLDLSSFDTSLVTNTNGMFRYCNGMATIYASVNFVVSQVTNSTNMLRNMSSNLVGGAGTVWSSSNPTDKTYAKIDGGVSDPGYFTLKS